MLVVSDSHLSDRTPEAVANWRRVVDHVAEVAPDLVVHLGDASLDGVNRPEELGDTRAWLDELTAPWRIVPGNHDVGDTHDGRHATAVDALHRDRWTQRFGPDWWSVDVAAWTVVGLDAQLLGSGLDAEVEQWTWLASTLDTIDPERPMLLAVHKPVEVAEPELDAAPRLRFVPPASRRRLADLWARRRAPVTVSGHVHQARDLVVDGRRHVWAPSTWGVFTDEMQPSVGEKRSGITALTLSADGGIEVDSYRPDGLAQLTIGLDTPNPFL